MVSRNSNSIFNFYEASLNPWQKYKYHPRMYDTVIAFFLETTTARTLKKSELKIGEICTYLQLYIIGETLRYIQVKC